MHVLQEQFTEYLVQKQADAERLESLAAQVFSNNDGAHPSALRLLEEIKSAAEEARSTASQVKAETDRLIKRSQEEDHVTVTKKSKDDRTPALQEEDGDTLMADGIECVAQQQQQLSSIKERAKYIPMRLTHEERRLLRLLEGALSVSEYTDKVDVLTWRSKTGRIQAQIKDVCAILCGLTVAQNFKRGQQLIVNRDFDDLAEFFQGCFEVGRRYKVMNPEKMRDTYGKLLYLLQDSQDDEIAELLGFRCVSPLRTVHSVLEAGGALKLLSDPLLGVATAEIDARGLSRFEVQKQIKAKEKARDLLARKYKTPSLPEEDLLQCMYSIGDENSYLAFNRDPIDRAISYLQHHFSPDDYSSKETSLAISGGVEGARLSHSHGRQYSFVLQSMTLWREISNDMFKLWTLAEEDLLAAGNRYRLTNTGQGLNRVQAAPRVSKAMHTILARCQSKIGSWVGSSVIHLGDHNVPNALLFIDKYSQVNRILNPVISVIEELPKLCAKDKGVKSYIESLFGSEEACVGEILRDLFRHGFDGSGADNFFDAGSCIDGRLTSAWNWCSKLEKKRYYQVFKLCGFVGFDGDFKGN